jgi:hypothetical protein
MRDKGIEMGAIFGSKYLEYRVRLKGMSSQAIDGFRWDSNQFSRLQKRCGMVNIFANFTHELSRYQILVFAF